MLLMPKDESRNEMMKAVVSCCRLLEVEDEESGGSNLLEWFEWWLWRLVVVNVVVRGED